MSLPNETRLKWLQNTLQLVGTALVFKLTKHKGKTICLNSASGSAFTLPASTGKGQKVRCRVTVVPTSNSHTILTKSSADSVQGSLIFNNGGTVTGYKGTSSNHTITLNGTTTGGASIGDYVELEDVSVGVWAMTGIISASGTTATPLS